ncbi:MAG: thiamine phosphate synthase [Lachnospiraceae bacterium]|nr:thiamine phosphate synthase [Lachnospiraceae bacterium]
MSMYKICVTNRKLVSGDFLSQIARVLEKKPYAIILREKDLSAEEYEKLAGRVKGLCDGSDTLLILHSFPEVAKRLGVDRLHMPLAAFLEMSIKDKRRFRMIGVSIHSVEEAIVAEANGATYITAGHVFVTDCKKGVPPRGISFLREVCDAVSIPVYAIGGVHEENMKECIAQGAAGVCMMSDFMSKQ